MISKANTVLIVLYLAFISIGLPDSALGIAWPKMREDFNQPLDSVGILIGIIIFCSAISSYSSGYLINNFSISKILIASTIFIIIGLVGYITSSHWGFVLLSGVPFGLGAGAIDCSLNNYAAKNLSSRHVNWLHGFWGIGTTLGPIILTSVYIFDLSWKIGFVILLLILTLLLLIFISTKGIWQETQIIKEKQKRNFVFEFDAILSSLFFGFYVTLETSVGLWYYSYLVEYKNISSTDAGLIISAYWGIFAIGRFVVGYITKWISDDVIITSGIVISICVLCFVFMDVYWAIVALGFALAGIYPCMVTQTHKRFKQETADVLMGQQIGTSYLSLMILVPFIGFLSDKFGLQYLVYCFVFLAILLFIINLRLRKLSSKL